MKKPPPDPNRPIRHKRIVVAGQIPPPFGGQAIMIQRLVEDLRKSGRVQCDHLPFYFTKDTQIARKAGLGKLLQVVSVLLRLLQLRLRGPIDLLIFPAGGPQIVPIIRDLLLLPWMLLASRHLAIHFHAGGIADHLPSLPGLLRRGLIFLSGRATVAIVMTDFGRRDPLSLGLRRILCVPHALEDTFRPELPEQSEGKNIPRLLYIGHLCPDKGTLALLQALSQLRRRGLAFHLTLVGECLAPCTPEELDRLIHEHDLESCIERPGVLRAEQKWARFAAADLFLFPSIAPYESFGLSLVEAMMWSLPVLTTDWRGNREVLAGDDPSTTEFCFNPGTDLARNLENALTRAFEKRSSWKKIGAANRRTFEQRYDAKKFPHRLADELIAFSAEL